MKCPKCGAEHTAKFCPECGTPAEASAHPVANQVSNPNYQSQAPAKKKVGCLKIGLIAFGIFAVLGTIGNLLGVNDSSAPAAASSSGEKSASAPQSVAPAKTDAEKNIDKLSKSLEITPELAADLQDKYTQIGIDDIGEIKKSDDWESGARFDATYGDYILTAYEKDGKVESIRSGDVYFYENGAVAFKVQDKLLTTAQELHLMSYAETAVEDNLKSPKSADFPGHIMDKGEWTVQKSDADTYYVKAYVDAENSFGASMRSDFIVTFSWDGSVDTVPQAIDVQIQQRQ